MRLGILLLGWNAPQRLRTSYFINLYQGRSLLSLCVFSTQRCSTNTDAPSERGLHYEVQQLRARAFIYLFASRAPWIYFRKQQKLLLIQFSPMGLGIWTTDLPSQDHYTFLWANSVPLLDITLSQSRLGVLLFVLVPLRPRWHGRLWGSAFPGGFLQPSHSTEIETRLKKTHPLSSWGSCACILQALATDECVCVCVKRSRACISSYNLAFQGNRQRLHFEIWAEGQ